MGGGPESPDLAREEIHLLISLPRPEPKGEIEALRKKFPHVRITWHHTSTFFADPATLPADFFKDCTIICTFFTLPADPARDAPNLKWVHLMSAGVNRVDKHPIWKDESITLTSSTGIHGPQIAEWFTMTTLVSSHDYNALHDTQKQHRWDPASVDAVRDLVGQRLGVLGYGSIGRQAARVAKAMGMDVVAYTATPKHSPDSRRDKGFIVPGTGDPNGEIPSEWYSGLDKKNLHNFLAQDLDILLVSVPLTHETHHFLSTPEFAILAKNQTFISNISRGPILDQAALITALKAKQLRGAALDVTDPEPLPQDSELWDLDNVIVTPHVSGRGLSYLPRAFMILETNIERWLNGEQMWNVVQRKRGY